MNRLSPLIGWVLAVITIAVCVAHYGWAGLALALSVIIFSLLLQFSRTLRLMRRAASRPVGHIESAVMLQAKLRPGLKLADVIGLTGSLGRRLPHASPGAEESWEWRDSGGDGVVVDFRSGRSVGASLLRAASDPRIEG